MKETKMPPSRPLKKIAKRPATVKLLLNEGDEISFGLSQELPYPKGASTWVSVSATTTILPGESHKQAQARLSRFVEDTLHTKCEEIIG
jgi:hypothetical protein